MKTIKRICKAIDTFTDKTGFVFSFLVLGILAVIICEVVLRRLFNKPQIWTQDLIVMLFACYIVLICAYGFLHRSFVAVDVLFAKLPKRGQYILHLITYAVFLLPFEIGMVTRAWPFFMKSFLMNEKGYSVWAPPVWPIKFCLFIGFLFLMVQSVSEILKQVLGIMDPEHFTVDANGYIVDGEEAGS